MALGDPSAVVAEGVHQQVGKCHVIDFDLSNYSRYKYLCPRNSYPPTCPRTSYRSPLTSLTLARYLCPKDFDEDFSFACVPKQKLPQPVPTWYTVCGKAHSAYGTYVGAVAALGGTASLVLAVMLLPARRPPPASTITFDRFVGVA